MAEIGSVDLDGAQNVLPAILYVVQSNSHVLRVAEVTNQTADIFKRGCLAKHEENGFLFAGLQGELRLQRGTRIKCSAHSPG